jgi:type II secretory pathway component PulM
MRVYANLSARERILLFLVLPAALLLAGFRFGWQPLQDLRATREAEIASYRLVAQAAAQAGTQIVAVEPDPTPFATRVTQSAEAAGLELRRIEPEGERLRVAVKDAPFTDLVLWIADLEAERNVTLSAIELDRRIAPGTVTARLLLETSR